MHSIQVPSSLASRDCDCDCDCHGAASLPVVLDGDAKTAAASVTTTASTASTISTATPASSRRAAGRVVDAGNVHGRGDRNRGSSHSNSNSHSDNNSNNNNNNKNSSNNNKNHSSSSSSSRSAGRRASGGPRDVRERRRHTRLDGDPSSSSKRPSLRRAKAKSASDLRAGTTSDGRGRGARAAEMLELAEVAHLSSSSSSSSSSHEEEEEDGERQCGHRCGGLEKFLAATDNEGSPKRLGQSHSRRQLPRQRQSQRQQHHHNFLERLFDSLNMEVATTDHSASFSSRDTEPIRDLQFTSAAGHPEKGNDGRDDKKNAKCDDGGDSAVGRGITSTSTSEEEGEAGQGEGEGDVALAVMEIKSSRSFISHETIDSSFRDPFIEGDDLPQGEGMPFSKDSTVVQSSIHLQGPHHGTQHHHHHHQHHHNNNHPRQQQRHQHNSSINIKDKSTTNITNNNTAKTSKLKSKSSSSRSLQKEPSTKRFSTESILSVDHKHRDNVDDNDDDDDDGDSFECIGGDSESDTHANDYGRLVETAFARRSSVLSEASRERCAGDDRDVREDLEPRRATAIHGTATRILVHDNGHRNTCRNRTSGIGIADELGAETLAPAKGDDERTSSEAAEVAEPAKGNASVAKSATAAVPETETVTVTATATVTPSAASKITAQTTAMATPSKHPSFRQSKPDGEPAPVTTKDSHPESQPNSRRKGKTKSSSFHLPSSSQSHHSHSKAETKGRRRSNSMGQEMNTNSSIKCDTPSVLLDLIIEFQKGNPPIFEDEEIIDHNNNNDNDDHVDNDDISKEKQRQRRREPRQRHRRQQDGRDDLELRHSGKRPERDDHGHRRSRRRDTVIEKQHNTDKDSEREKEKEKLRNSLRRSLRKSSTGNTIHTDRQLRSSHRGHSSNLNETDFRRSTTASHRKSARRREGDNVEDIIILEDQNECGTMKSSRRHTQEQHHQHQQHHQRRNQHQPKKKGHTPPVPVIYALETPSAEKFSLSEDQMMEFCEGGATSDVAGRRDSSERLAVQPIPSSNSQVTENVSPAYDSGTSRNMKERRKEKNRVCKNGSVGGGASSTKAHPEVRSIRYQDASVTSDEGNSIDVGGLEFESESKSEDDQIEGELGHVSPVLKQDRELDSSTTMDGNNPSSENDGKDEIMQATQQPPPSENAPPMDLSELRKMKMMEQMMQAKKQFDEMRQKQLSFTSSEMSAKERKGRTHRRSSLGSLRKKSQVHPSPQRQESEQCIKNSEGPSLVKTNGYASSSDSSSDSDSGSSKDRSIEIISTSDSCGDDSIDINNSDDSSIDDFNASSDDFSDGCDLESEEISDIYAPLSIPIPAEIPNILFDASEESFMDSEMDMGLHHTSALIPEASADVTVIPSSMSVLTNSTREKSESRSESYHMLIDESIDDSSTSSCSSYDGSNPSNYTCEVNDNSQFFDLSAPDMSTGKSSAGLSEPDPTLDVLNSIVDDQSEGIDAFMASKVNLNDDGDDDNIQAATDTHSRGSRLSALHETDAEDSDDEIDEASSNFESAYDSDKSRFRSNSRASTDSASRKSGNSQRKILKKSTIIATIKAAATSAIHHKDHSENSENIENPEYGHEGKMSIARKSILSKSSRKKTSSLKLGASPDHRLDNGQSMKQIEDELRSKHPEPSAAIQKLRAKLRAHRAKQAENLTSLSKSLPSKLTEAEVSPARQVVHGKNGQTLCQRDDSQRRCKSLSGSANTANLAEMNEIINNVLQEQETKSPFSIPADIAREVDANSLRTESSEESDDPATSFLHSIEKRQRDLVLREGSRLKPERRHIASPISQSVITPSLHQPSGHMLSASKSPPAFASDRCSFPDTSSSLLHNSRGSRRGRLSDQACVEDNRPYTPDRRFNRSHFQSYNNRRHTSDDLEPIIDRYGHDRRRHRSKSFLHHHGPSHRSSYSHEEQVRRSYHYEDRYYDGVHIESEGLDSSAVSDRSIQYQGGSGLVSWDELGDAINLGLYKSISEVNSAVIEMQAMECDSLGSSGRSIHAATASATIPAASDRVENSENEYKTNPEEPWECSVCTFINEHGLHLVCAVCNSPRFSPEM